MEGCGRVEGGPRTRWVGNVRSGYTVGFRIVVLVTSEFGPETKCNGRDIGSVLEHLHADTTTGMGLVCGGTVLKYHLLFSVLFPCLILK